MTAPLPDVDADDVIVVAPVGLPPIPMWSRRPLALAAAELLDGALLDGRQMVRCQNGRSGAAAALAHALTPISQK